MSSDLALATKTPRILIAGTASGVGKTTISLGLMAAFKKSGLRVQGFKVGPDYIDPSYYEAVTERPGRNLDNWMVPKDTIRALFVRQAVDVDLAVVEGVMGLFDGKSGYKEAASTAEVAKILKSPVLLVLDCSKGAQSLAAVACGFSDFDPDVNIAGFILNNLGGANHHRMVREAVEASANRPVVGYFNRNQELVLPERHLGLVPAGEKSVQPDFLDKLVGQVESCFDLKRIFKIAREAELLSSTNGLFGEDKQKRKARIAVARDQAFNFYYQDNLDLLETFGAELVPFSPLSDSLPEHIDGLYLGGGFPEVFAAELSENSQVCKEIKDAVTEGLPVYAECGGLLYLSRDLQNFDGRVYPMVGVLPFSCRMNQKLSLGYREIETQNATPLFEPGVELRGHEFHYSTLLHESDAGAGFAYKIKESDRLEGFARSNILASYIHLHFAGKPSLARNFVESCFKFQKEFS